jgi:hypothetical protein
MGTSFVAPDGGRSPAAHPGNGMSWMDDYRINRRPGKIQSQDRMAAFTKAD